MTPYDPSIGIAKQVLIVDASIAYDCEFTNKTYILIFRNSLHVPTLEHNLITPFILDEAGIICNYRPKIDCSEPSEAYHFIIHKDSGLRIPLKLNAIFLYFHSRKPTRTELESEDKIFFTPDSDNWNPYSNHYAKNEESMIKWQGEIIPVKIR